MRRRRASSAQLQAGELSYELDNLRAAWRGRDEPDLAHISHVELLTPEPEREPASSTSLGMEIEAREGQSVFLRGWGDYQRWSLKLTEAAAPASAHMAMRASSAEALSGRWRSSRRPGSAGLERRRHGHGHAYRFRDPDGHS